MASEGVSARLSWIVAAGVLFAAALPARMGAACVAVLLAASTTSLAFTTQRPLRITKITVVTSLEPLSLSPLPSPWR